MIILALDGLDLSLVKKFNCRCLQQTIFGQTDIGEFTLPKTVVLWSSFLTGRNMEFSVGADLWAFRVPKEQTFLRFFLKIKVIDLPGFSYRRDHVQERRLLKQFFQRKDEEKTLKRYNQTAWQIHQKTKREFLGALGGKNDLLIGYFALADVIGHLNFGNQEEMRKVYRELDQIAGETKQKMPEAKILVISDHGLKSAGRFGDHTSKGFYSLNFQADLPKTPKITDFFGLFKT